MFLLIYVEINCSLSLSFFSVTRRVIYVGDKRGGIPRAYRRDLRGFHGPERRRGEDTCARAFHGAHRVARCMCRDCRGLGKSRYNFASWTRANGIACVFLHLKDLKDGVNDTFDILTAGPIIPSDRAPHGSRIRRPGLPTGNSALALRFFLG